MVDAIDHVKAKAHLIHHCTIKNIPLIVSGGAGGLTDPTQITSADITKVYNDPLIKQVRNKLRSQYNFPKGDAKKPKKFGIDCIFSTELPVLPTCQGETAKQQDKPAPQNLNCATGFGSITHMTATVGFFAAAQCLQFLAKQANSVTREASS